MSNILRLFTYLNVITALIEFIRNAESVFGGGNGSAKKEDVLPRFTALIDALRSVRLISDTNAARLIAGAAVLIDTLVLVLNASGLMPQADASDAQASTETTSVSG